MGARSRSGARDVLTEEQAGEHEQWAPARHHVSTGCRLLQCAQGRCTQQVTGRLDRGPDVPRAGTRSSSSDRLARDQDGEANWTGMAESGRHCCVSRWTVGGQPAPWDRGQCMKMLCR